MAEEHSSLIKTWQQLVVVVAASFIVPVVLIMMIASLVTSGTKGLESGDSALLARIQPLGAVLLASGPRAALSGEQTYQQVCKTCHEAGLAGAPKTGDKAAWGKVLAQGEKLVVEHAIKGLKAMPPKGGNPDLSDAEVQAAVVHIANAAGANWKAPAAPLAAAAAPAGTAERTGAQVVEASCGKCHATGERGAPKVGDRNAWIQRAKRGLDSVYASALKGHAGMPARGGMAEFSDAEVKRAVEHMMNSGASAAAVPVAAIPAAAPAVAAKADGKKVHDTACMACHAAGVAGAPKTGDKGAWAPRIAQGTSVLHDRALKGFQGKAGVMPAKGGNATLSDEDVRAAVDYMVGVAK